MAISAFDLFKIGIGPSSSHTVGPMVAARRFAEALRDAGLQPATLRADLFGSLGATGRGHGTDKALILGLEGHRPAEIDPDAIPELLERVRREEALRLLAGPTVRFAPADMVFHRVETLPFHPNGLRLAAFAADGTVLLSKEYYSVGGGFVVTGDEAGQARLAADERALPRPFRSAAELLEWCRRDGLSFSAVMLSNESAWRPEAETRAGLRGIWSAMQACVTRGCATEGVLPGGLRVPRRAPALHRRLRTETNQDPLAVLDWVDLYALAVNEENAAGGRVVTAPTNGAAGVIPAVLHYYRRHCPGSDDAGVERFLLSAAAIAVLYKENASLSGAEVGCQGEVGVACSMAAGALAEVLGGTPAQVENAAEIGMEHNLGLTCDPVGGLVQIPCIERNAMGAVKAINAARMALRGDGSHKVSLDKVIKTMRETGADMQTKYKETSRGGLALNIVEC
jgi:L-serine dehydratase